MTKLVAKSGQAGTYKGTFLIRDGNGNPKFSDPNNVPQKILDVLDENDKKHLESLKRETV
jgi:hypothetical protein